MSTTGFEQDKNSIHTISSVLYESHVLLSTQTYSLRRHCCFFCLRVRVCFVIKNGLLWRWSNVLIYKKQKKTHFRKYQGRVVTQLYATVCDFISEGIKVKWQASYFLRVCFFTSPLAATLHSYKGGTCWQGVKINWQKTSWPWRYSRNYWKMKNH